jgi:hypothetical protein
MFRRYEKLKRLGMDEVKGITKGVCYVFPKLDGTNASVWIEDSELKAGSRNRQLTLEKDNQGFYAWVLENKDSFLPLLKKNPDLRLYGEWLVPHTLKTYVPEAWRKFYLFDVYSHSKEKYLDYHSYIYLFKCFEPESIEVVPAKGMRNPTRQQLLKFMKNNTYMMQEGCVGEGIVIKRYDFVNQYGRTLWAKLVNARFREQHKSKETVTSSIEEAVASKYVTRGRVEKILAKMRESEPLSRQRIPEFFGRIWHDILDAEMYEIVKDNKRPIIDFADLYHCIIAKSKEMCYELF